ncbi:MAG: transposase [Sphingomonadales bacterium]|nr:transposase [Sphingomonadales bacterium]MDE2170254.1 transposase [Sphingomonadales bacterium]
MTTKIVALVDALGNLVRFVLLPGQTHDLVGVKPLIQNVEFDMFLGDKAFDADWLRSELDGRGTVAVIPPKSNRKQKIDCDFHVYRWRHLVENFFCSLKIFQRIATRYEKTDQSGPISVRSSGRCGQSGAKLHRESGYSWISTVAGKCHAASILRIIDSDKAL